MKIAFPKREGVDLSHAVFGNLFFGVITYFSLYYAVERTTYVDSAWQFLLRVNDGGFYIPSNRFAVVPSEIPLLLVLKFHPSLHILMYIFSATYILLYYLIWRLCVFTFRNHAAGLTVILGIFMGIREAFIHTVNEGQQSMAYCALLFAMMSYTEWRWLALKYLSFAAGIFLCLFTSPLGIFTALFLAAYQPLQQWKKLDFKTWIPFITVLLIAFIRFFHPDNAYDAEQYSHLTSTGAIDSIFRSGVLRFLLMHSQRFYWLPELVLLLLTGWLIYRRKFLILVLLYAGISGTMLITWKTFNGDSSIMIERLYLPSFFMLNLVFANEILSPEFKWKYARMFLILFLSVNGIRYINTGCLIYRKRVQLLHSLIDKTRQTGSDKGVIPKNFVPDDKLMVTWALGTETLLLSSIDGKGTVTVTEENGMREPGLIQISGFDNRKKEWFDARYFKWSDSPYLELK